MHMAKEQRIGPKRPTIGKTCRLVSFAERVVGKLNEMNEGYFDDEMRALYRVGIGDDISTNNTAFVYRSFL
jgi:hypothetical protein